MPVGTDGKGRRALALEVELPGTPEQVWQAVATGPGFSAWFVPTMLEEHVGGKVVFALGGGMESVGEVTEWRPPEALAFVEPVWAEGAPPLATEITVEALGGGTCLMRMVHSIPVGDATWDDEIGSMETGWPGFFAVLELYLAHFAGEKAASARPMGPFDGSVAGAMDDVAARLGLAGAAVGERRASPEGAPVLGGIVERVDRRESVADLMLRLDAPGPGALVVGAFAMGGGTHVGISLFFYGDDAEAALAREGPRWEAWFADTYPAPA